MRPEITEISRAEVVDLISEGGAFGFDRPTSNSFQMFLRNTTAIWLWKINGKSACIWGINLPTLCDDRAYLWLHVTDAIKTYEFTFIRQSQIAMEKVLDRYPIVYGHAQIDNERAKRWLKWLGATFDEPEGPFLPFTIRKK